MLESGIQVNSENQTSLLAWDSEGSPPDGDCSVVLWRSFGETCSPDFISVPRLVEMHADELKKQYLTRIYELGELQFKGRRMIDHLELRPGFSAWWMSLLVEKNYGKSAGMYESIRMMAFEKWATNRSFGLVVLNSANARLAATMRLWCNRSGVAFEWQRMPDQAEERSWIKRLYDCLPHSVLALTWLVRHLFQSWPLRGVGVPEWRDTKGQVTFVSYLFNLVPDAVKEGRFKSPYWGNLPDELLHDGCKTNWLHLYVEDALLLAAKKAADVIRQFNETERGKQTHVTLDAFLGLRVVFRTLRDWYRITRIGRRLLPAFSSLSAPALEIWPLLEDDWHRSTSGMTAMSNALYLNLFEMALRSLPEQRIGVYLQENQGWEFALIHAWKAAGHARLIGSPHSTVRHWDLRYFFDPRSYSRDGVNCLPMPDQVTFNGKAEQDAYQKGGYPVADMVEVEALRYPHLDNNRADANPAARSLNSSLRVLVLGDYLFSVTQQQMRLLEKAVKSLPAGVAILVKPHPACPIEPADYPDLKMEVTMDPVSNLLTGCDVAYTSSITSAAVDAFCAGTPVVSVLDPNMLNLSPLRGREGVLFVSTAENLAHALISAASAPRKPAGQQDFFTLDYKLPRWRKLLLERIG